MHRPPPATILIFLLVGLAGLPAQDAPRTAGARLAALQQSAIDSRDQQRERLYGYGHQGLSGVFSTHRTHSNRAVPVWAYGPFADLRPYTGRHSAYRDGARLAEIYGARPPRSLADRAEYGDQTDVHRLLLSAADAGARRLVVLLMDGADWQVYAAASVVKSGRYDAQGYQQNLAFCGGASPELPMAVGAVVTSPLRGAGVPPGFDLDRGGRFPWSPQDAVYLAGDLRMDQDAAGAARSGLHAVVDSAASATAIFSGRKTLNGRVNTDGAGEPIEPLGRALQRRGWAIATVTDVPFNHASPAAVYASVASRSRYRDIGRQMLGLGLWPGADVVLGYGLGYGDHHYLAAEDLRQVREASPYYTVTPESGEDAAALLGKAAAAVAAQRRAGHREATRLFGLFGGELYDHAPYRTADGDYQPTRTLDYGSGAPSGPEVYDEAILRSHPDLQTMTRAAQTVLEAVPERPFLLFVEAGLVDWSNHANNLDHAVGEVFSAERCFEQLTAWITEQGWWDETLLVVTSDHGHLLQVDLDGLAAQLHRE